MLRLSPPSFTPPFYSPISSLFIFSPTPSLYNSMPSLFSFSLTLHFYTSPEHIYTFLICFSLLIPCSFFLTSSISSIFCSHCLFLPHLFLCNTYLPIYPTLFAYLFYFLSGFFSTLFSSILFTCRFFIQLLFCNIYLSIYLLSMPISSCFFLFLSHVLQFSHPYTFHIFFFCLTLPFLLYFVHTVSFSTLL